MTPGHIIPFGAAAAAATLTKQSETTYAQTGSQSNHTITLPAHEEDDLIVIVAGWTESGVTPADLASGTPSGWRKVAEVEAGNASAVGLALYSKIAASGSETNPAIGTFSNQTPLWAAVQVWEGPSSATEDDVGTTVQESGTDIDSPALSVTDGNYLVIRGFVFDDDVSTEADHDSDAGWQGTSYGYVEVSTPGNGLAFCMSSEDYSGTTPAASTFSSNADSDAGCALAAAFAY